jgi:hypothetical protein
MLINDDSRGASDGKEKDQLQAMITVGSEFMTYRDAESTIQRSGEFVRIEREPEGTSQPRFVLLHETSMTHAEQSPDDALTGNELLNLSPDTKLLKRSRLFMSEQDTAAGDLPFREISGFKTQTRISRHYGPITGTDQFGNVTSRTRDAIAETSYTAQAGKRRFFAKGDGKVILVREVAVSGDNRYFNDSMGKLVTTPRPHTKKRGLRAARVEVVEVNPLTGATSAPLFSFDVHSGLGFDPTPRSISDSIRQTTADMYSSTSVFVAFAGAQYGSYWGFPDTGKIPTGDASDTYAVCEPGIAKTDDGREYTAMIAVYPAADDVYDSRSSGPYRLTCKRTTPQGGVALGKINFPSLPSLPKHYLAARGMSLHRLGPSKVVLRVIVHAMQFGAGGSVQASSSDAFFMWSTNNGETWTYVVPSASLSFPSTSHYGGLLTQDKNTLLAFSRYETASPNAIEVFRITTSGATKISTIPAAVFGAGLTKPGPSGNYYIPYAPLGFGGAVYRSTPEGKKKRLWMQFDPYSVWEESKTLGGTPFNISYPGARPMLLVSDDGGITWARRLLPTPWCFRAGFVVAIDDKTLAVPVMSARTEPGKPIDATIYLSDNGGDSWKATRAQISLPGKTWVDGQIVVGRQWERNSVPRFQYEQDISESATQYNRGELLPMIALRDKAGKLLPSNPARPWMADHKFKEPDYG